MTERKVNMTESELRRRRKIFVLDAQNKVNECFMFLGAERDRFHKEVDHFRLICDYFKAVHFLRNLSRRLLGFATATDLSLRDKQCAFGANQDVEDCIYVLKQAELMEMSEEMKKKHPNLFEASRNAMSALEHLSKVLNEIDGR